MTQARRAIVVGAGIGGLTAALALRRVGFEVVVFERRTELGEVNTGLSLWAFAIRRLAALGLSDPDAFGVPIERLVHRTSTGRLLTDVAVPNPVGARSYDVHRGQLQERLAAAVGEERIHLGKRCVAVRQAADRVQVELDGGEVEAGDLAIGATASARPSGLRSSARWNCAARSSASGAGSPPSARTSSRTGCTLATSAAARCSASPGSTGDTCAGTPAWPSRDHRPAAATRPRRWRSGRSTGGHRR
jgi:2-polyprenyl-6-methoxyphenol hydroxylase-like FAD-dependent oxidoreductase